MSDATYTAWDDNLYEWPPPEGWYQAHDGKWWPEGYGPPEQFGVAEAVAPPSMGGVSPHLGDPPGQGDGLDSFGFETGPTAHPETQSDQGGGAQSDPLDDQDGSEASDADSLLEDLGIEVVASPQEREELAAKRAVYDDPPPIDDVFGGADPFDDDDDEDDAQNGQGVDNGVAIVGQPDVPAEVDAPVGAEQAGIATEGADAGSDQAPPQLDDPQGPSDELSSRPGPQQEASFPTVNPAGTMVLGAEELAEGTEFGLQITADPVAPPSNGADTFIADTGVEGNEPLGHEPLGHEPLGHEPLGHESSMPPSFEHHDVGREMGADANQIPSQEQPVESAFYHDTGPTIGHEVVSEGESYQPHESHHQEVHGIRHHESHDHPVDNRSGDYGFQGAQIGQPHSNHEEMGRNSGYGGVANVHQGEEPYESHIPRSSSGQAWGDDQYDEESRSLLPWVAISAVLVVAAIVGYLVLTQNRGGSEDQVTDDPGAGESALTDESTSRGSFANPYPVETKTRVFYQKEVEGPQYKWVIQVLQPGTDVSTAVRPLADPAISDNDVVVHARLRVSFQEGPTSGQFGELNFVAIDTQGNRYDSNANDCALVGEPLVNDVVLQPDEAVEGDLCWRLPRGSVSGLVLGIEADPVPGTEHIRLR